MLIWPTCSLTISHASRPFAIQASGYRPFRTFHDFGPPSAFSCIWSTCAQELKCQRCRHHCQYFFHFFPEDVAQRSEVKPSARLTDYQEASALDHTGFRGYSDATILRAHLPERHTQRSLTPRGRALDRLHCILGSFERYWDARRWSGHRLRSPIGFAGALSSGVSKGTL